MLLVTILLMILLFGLVSVRPNDSQFSDFELRRRLDNRQDGALLQWRRGEFRREVMTIRRILVAILLVSVSTLLIDQAGWLWGALLATVLILTYNRIASFIVIRGFAQRIYNKYEDAFLQFVEKWQRFISPLSGIAETQNQHQIASREELVYTLDNLTDLLLKDERKMLDGMMTFRDKLVRDYMTPRSVMEAIGANELLGPLVLDNLHRTGHTHFPVMDGDIDHLVGILHIYSLFTLENKKSLAVKDAMESRVFYIHQDQTLDDALSACIKHRRHLLVVVNEYRETVGVITIEDVVEQLIGRKIVDQFSEHDDLRAVAARNPRGNNTPKNHVDV